MKRIADNFTNRHSVVKTTTFSLIPVGKTQEYITEREVINEDKERNELAFKVKKLINEFHRSFISKILKDYKFDEEDLNSYYQSYIEKKERSKNTKKKSKEEKGKDNEKEAEFKNLKTRMRKSLRAAFTNDPVFDTLNKKELFTKTLPKFYSDNPEALEQIGKFKRFTSYFTGFNSSKMLMYSEEDKYGSIPNRLVSENLPKYIENIHVFNRVYDIDEIRERIDSLFNELNITKEMYFEVVGFNNTISQEGIDKYNTIIGGISKEDGSRIQGLNEIVNLYNQDFKKKLPKFQKLFKQILSISDSASFIPSKIASDEEVFEAINETYENLMARVFESKNEINLIDLISSMSKYDLSKIYVSKDELTYISNKLYGDWAYINYAISDNYDKTHKVKRSQNAYDKEKESVLKKIKQYSICNLNTYLEGYGLEANLEKYFTDKVEAHLEEIQDKYFRYSCIDTNKYLEDMSLKSNDTDKVIINELLESINNLKKCIRCFHKVDENLDVDAYFYDELNRIYELLENANSVYTRVRNYISGKPYSDDTYPLNFSVANFMGGWSYTKETTNKAQIYMKDGMYYLGIINKGNNKWVENIPAATSDNTYKKLVYRIVGSAGQQINKLFPVDEKDMHEKIRKQIELIKNYEKWNVYNFSFKDPYEYKDYEEFTADVNEQGYYMEFVDVDAEFVDNLVENGDLYLFKIHNKDLTGYAKGTPDPYTMYFKEAFSDENIKHKFIKLGAGELRYREASIKEKDLIIHPAGVPIKNKNPLNPKEYSVYSHDITKDRRFSKDAFKFHLPLTINYSAEKLAATNLNQEVNLAIHNAPELPNVIGIDRGENNLVYVTVIDSLGNILEQKSFNTVESKYFNGVVSRTDYKEVLKKIGNDANKSRRNCTRIASTKNAKMGYCSQIVSVIAKWMIEYNAVLALEKLDKNFKNRRKFIGNSIYGEFEKALIKKLNYYVDKHLDYNENGGLRKGYTLTNAYSDDEKVWQSGFVYYVPASYTSKIDPTTGFTNHFFTRYENINKSREFIGKLERVYFDSAMKMYAFDCDYHLSNFKTENFKKHKWTVYSFGSRIKVKRDHQNNKIKYNLNLTEEFDKLFSEYNIPRNLKDLRTAMVQVESADFYHRFMDLFYLMVELRNSDYDTGLDQIISPVMNADGKFFVSGEVDNMPKDADANGSYNIALKCLMKLQKIKSTDLEDFHKLSLAISDADWVNFCFERTSKKESIGVAA